MCGKLRILLTSIGSLGDLHPILTLALGLKQRGHEVTIATIEFYREKVIKLGLSFHAIRPDMQPHDPSLIRRLLDLRNGPSYLIRELLLPSISETYDDLLVAGRQHDLLVGGEIVFALPLVAETLNKPWVSVLLSPASFFSSRDPSVIAPLPMTKHLVRGPNFFYRLILKLGNRIARQWSEPIKELRDSISLPYVDNPLMSSKYSSDLNLALFSSAFAEPQIDWAAKTFQPGFVFFDQVNQSPLEPELADFLKHPQRPIVFTLGSAAVYDAGSFYTQSAIAASRLNHRALLLVGDNEPPKNLPATIAVAKYADYSQVFPSAACVVHQGGIGTTAQCLRAGVRQVVVPFAFDQPDNAARVCRLKLGRTIARRRYSAKSAALAINDLLNDQHAEKNAIAIATLIQSEDGLAAACTAIEALGQTNRSNR